MSGDVSGAGAASAGTAAPRPVIGLEIHCQMTSLKSKLFCPCRADYRGMGPNENVCPVCMGMPGTLPRLNAEAVRRGTMIAMALGCAIPERISFFRKNYFYPDLPKNFQITQLDMYGDTSIGGRGSVLVDGGTVGIRRVQLEEDPGRMVYEGASARNRISLVDYNRAGTPLVEIVTEPDFEGPRQLRLFLQMLSDMVENLGVSNPALEGAMRADANVSLEGGNRVEIKNISSFHDLEKAVVFEIARQEAQHSRGLEVVQETRHWDAARKITVPSRLKEEEKGYRYLLEADIPWVRIDAETVESLRSRMPESVSEKRERFVSQYMIPPQVADVLSSDKTYSDLFDAARTGKNARELANIITTDLMGLVMATASAATTTAPAPDSDAAGGDAQKKRDDPASDVISVDGLRELADAVASGQMARNSAKQALHEMAKTGKSLAEVSSEMDLGLVSDESELLGVVRSVISEEPQAAEQASSNPNTVNYLVGKVMQKTRGKADPQVTLELLKRCLPVD